MPTDLLRPSEDVPYAHLPQLSSLPRVLLFRLLALPCGRLPQPKVLLYDHSHLLQAMLSVTLTRDEAVPSALSHHYEAEL